ncbi:MAG: pyruvate, phosphate dikinase, partial [Bacteroidetes bacterium]
IPNYFILNNSSDVPYFLKNSTISKIPENLFVWNGDSKVFFTMVKLLEDMVNAANDVKLGITKIILLVEDSPVFYSKYLSILYSLVLEQTQHLIEDVGSDDMYKVLRLRARPKILHAKTYEDAQDIINEFGDNLLCVISDIRFPRKNVLSDTAGFDLISEVKKKYENLLVVLQSSDPQNRKRSEGLNAHFMYKDSDSLVQELKYFINY